MASLRAAAGCAVLAALFGAGRSIRVTGPEPESASAGDPLSTALDMASAGEALLEVAKAATGLGAKWKAAVHAVVEVGRASWSLGEADAELGARLRAVREKIRRSRFGILFRGHGRLDDLKGVDVDSADTCLDIMVQLVSCAEALATFGEVAQQLVELIAGIQKVTNGTAQLARAWSGADLGGRLGPLSESVGKVARASRTEAEALAAAYGELEALMRDWQKMSLRPKGPHIEDGRAIAAEFVRLGNASKAVGRLQRDKTGPIHRDLRDLAESMLRSARSFSVPGVELQFWATETIDMASCASRSTRRFSAGAAIDTMTMSCRAEPITGAQWCQCRGKGDCYAVQDHRPPPRPLKRCFRPA